MGADQESFEFLGCQITGALVAPGKKARASLLSDIDEILTNAKSVIRKAIFSKNLSTHELRETQALNMISLAIKGWGEAFAFCNSRNVISDIDSKIDERVAAFKVWVTNITKKLNSEQKRRALGVTLLQDIAQKPLNLSTRVDEYRGKHPIGK